MNVEEILDKQSELGSEQMKKIFMNHGTSGNLFGVKRRTCMIGDIPVTLKTPMDKCGKLFILG